MKILATIISTVLVSSTLLAGDVAVPQKLSKAFSITNKDDIKVVTSEFLTKYLDTQNFSYYGRPDCSIDKKSNDFICEIEFVTANVTGRGKLVFNQSNGTADTLKSHSIVRWPR